MTYPIQKIFLVWSRKENQKITRALKCFHSNQYSNKTTSAASCNSYLSVKNTNFASELSLRSIRYFSRYPKSWFRLKKKNYDIVYVHEVSPRRIVPKHILKPDYAESGIATEPDAVQMMNEDEVRCMRQSCALAKVVLDEVAKNIKVNIFLINAS